MKFNSPVHSAIDPANSHAWSLVTVLRNEVDELHQLGTVGSRHSRQLSAPVLLPITAVALLIDYKWQYVIMLWFFENGNGDGDGDDFTRGRSGMGTKRDGDGWGWGRWVMGTVGDGVETDGDGR